MGKIRLIKHIDVTNNVDIHHFNILVSKNTMTMTMLLNQLRLYEDFNCCHKKIKSENVIVKWKGT